MKVPLPALKLRDFDDLNDEIDFLFNSYFKSRRSVLMPMDKGWKPLTDMYETDQEVVIVMDIAGISTNDIKLRLDGNILILRGLRRELHVDSKRKYYKMEIDFGPFERNIELPCPIDPDRVTAHYSKGFLAIRLHKHKTATSKRVEIKIL